MSDKQKKFYLTTPIYYVNARPHIGHAYTTLVADTIARRHRLLGDDTFFLTGTDEHGQKIERSAAAAGIPPQQFTDEVSAEFRNLWARMGLTNDDFIRTTEPRHQQGAQRLFALLHQRGQIYLSSYTGQYSIGEEIFVDGPPGVLGPDGKPTETVTEENFFFRLSEYQLPLIDLIESDTLLIQPESRKNEVLSFLRGPIAAHLSETAAATKATDAEAAAIGHAAALSAFALSESTPFGTLISGEAALLVAMDAGHAAEQAAHEAAALSPESAENSEAATGTTVAYSRLGKPYLKGALRDLSVSRSSFTWGIPVPEPAASETKQKHVIYVWLDALANYMTAVGYGSDDPEKIAQFERYWPADVHIMAKEITRQHCIYWPAFLLAANLPLPKAVTAHGWLLFDDSKMSKSKGNIVRTETILDAFGTLCPPTPSPSLLSSAAPLLSSRSGAEGSASPETPRPPTKREQDLFAADVLRYFLLREVPFGQDGSFSFEAMITRYNADLANGYGNLVSRTLSLVKQNFADGLEMPKDPWLFPDRQSWRGDNAPIGAEAFSGTRFIINELFDLSKDAEEMLWPTHRYQILLAGIMLRIGHVDGYLSYHKPWSLAKSTDPLDHQKLIESLYTSIEAIRVLTALLYPFIPTAAAKVWAQLGLGDIEAAAKNGDLKNLEWGGLKPGTKLGPLSSIFPRADKGLAQIMTDMESSSSPKPTPSRFIDEKTVNTEPASTNTTDPGAGPRTSALNEENPGAQVGASAAAGPELIRTPPHAESPASEAFAASAAGSSTPDTPQIAIDDFVKIDLRVAQIVIAERIPKADKLLRLEVDLGYEKRQILSGIAEWYTPEELVGRRIVVITNLAPRKMRGLESHGMLLAASNGDNGKPILATFAEDIALGSRLR
jgi:methionyl-tRNA synthetase